MSSILATANDAVQFLFDPRHMLLEAAGITVLMMRRCVRAEQSDATTGDVR